MRTACAPTEGTAVAIASLLTVCMLVCGLLGFGFYKLMQPRQIPNPGLAAYKPPPATVIIYPPVAQLPHKQEPVQTFTTDQSSRDTPDETTGRAVHIAEPATVVAPEPSEQTGKAEGLERQSSHRFDESSTYSFDEASAYSFDESSISTELRCCVSRLRCSPLAITINPTGVLAQRKPSWSHHRLRT